MNDFQSAFASMPVIGILRGVRKDSVLPAVNAAFDGGLQCLEITLNTPQALELIATAARDKRPQTFIGAGTVLTGAACEDAINAGARFIVAPAMLKDVVTVCKKRSIPVFPGALTPSEVYAAWEAGAYMVKVFPVSAMGGPSYIKELRGPFSSIRLLACGGVTRENLEEHFTAGADGIAIGGGIFKADWITAGTYSKIREKSQEFVQTLKKIQRR